MATDPHRSLTAADARAYVAAGGTRCPCCGSEEVSGGRIEADAGGAWQDVDCTGCGRAWQDAYTLTGIDVLDEQGRYAHSLDGTVPPTAASFQP